MNSKLQSNGFLLKHISLFSLIFVLFFVSLSSAAVEDFQAYAGNPVISGCTCVPVKDTIIISNTGNFVSTYTLTSDASSSAWSAYLPSSLQLNSGESAQVTHIMNPSCGSTVNQPVTTTIKTGFGIVKQFSQTLSISNCQNLDVTILNQTQRSCSGVQKKYDFIIRNTGQYAETYDLLVTPFENKTLYPSIVLIPAGQARGISVYVSPSDVGRLNYTLNVYARTSKFLAKAPFHYISEQCNDFTIDAGTFSACADAETTIPILVQNKGISKDTYYASLEGASWGTLENTKASAGTNKNAVFSVAVNPPVAGKLYNFYINVYGENGNLFKYTKFTVNSTKCYDVNIEVPEKQTVCCGAGNFNVKISNIGTSSESIMLSSENSSWTSAKPSVLSVAPRESSDAAIIYNAPCSGGEYPVIVNAYISGHENVNDSAVSKLNVLTKEQCYSLSVPKDTVKIYAGNTTKATFSVKPTGLKAASYYVSLSDVPYWVSMESGIYAVSYSNPANITLILSPNESVQSENYRVELKFDTVDDSASYIIPFNVKVVKRFTPVKSFVAFVINYSIYIIIIIIVLFLIWLINKLYVNHKTKQITQQILVEQEKLSPRTEKKVDGRKLAAERKKQKSEEERKKKKLLRFVRFAGICIVIILALLFLYASYHSNRSEEYQNATVLEDFGSMLSDLKNMVIIPVSNVAANETPESLTVEKNETFTYQYLYGEKQINLSKYFYDPDGGELTFTAETTGDVKVAISDDIADIKGLADNGTATVTFTAIDSSGASVSTPVITFVLKSADNEAGNKSTLTLFISAFVLIGIAIIILAAVSFYQTRVKGRKKKRR